MAKTTGSYIQLRNSFNFRDNTIYHSGNQTTQSAQMQYIAYVCSAGLQVFISDVGVAIAFKKIMSKYIYATCRKNKEH